MTKTIPSLLAILITSLAAVIQVTTDTKVAGSSIKDLESHWLNNPIRSQNQLLKKWHGHKRLVISPGTGSASSPFDVLHSNHQFKGCIDPSEPFQCPQSEKCIALQFICDGNMGDCPNNLDENEETCIAAKRPAKENIEKFLHAEYTLHGTRLFTFLFGAKVTKSIEENTIFWFDTIASAFSVSKNLRSFGEKTHMSPNDLAHFRKVLEIIHDGRLEEIPLFVQEAVQQGLGSLVEKLHESAFMES